MEFQDINSDVFEQYHFDQHGEKFNDFLMFLNHALEPNEVSFVRLTQVFTSWSKDVPNIATKNVPEPKDGNNQGTTL